MPQRACRTLRDADLTLSTFPQWEMKKRGKKVTGIRRRMCVFCLIASSRSYFVLFVGAFGLFMQRYKIRFSRSGQGCRRRRAVQPARQGGTAPSQVILRGEGMATGGSSGTARHRDVPVSRRTTDVLKVGLRLTESTICIACVCVLSTCTNDIGVKVKFQSFKTEMSELKIKGEA